MHLVIIALFFGGLIAGQVSNLATKQYAYEFKNIAITGGGFLTGFVAHPTAKELLYVRTDIGSTYKWNLTSGLWSPLTDFISQADFNYFGTESIALDPTNPDYLYLAQGQYFGGPSAFFVSSNRGKTFDIYPAPFYMGSNNLGRNNGERLAVNPFNTKQLYFGSRQEGLWMSNDRAKTWSNVTNIPNAATTDGQGIIFVIFDANTSGTIYIGANQPGGLYVTRDSGATWTQVPGQPLTWNGTATYAGLSPQSAGPLPMRALLGNNGVLYVTYADAAGPYGIEYGNVHKYNTNTGVWTDITPGNSGNNNNTYPLPLPLTYAPGGFCALSILPSDPDYVIVNTLNHYAGGSDTMFLSRDGGDSWKDVGQLSSPKGTNGNWVHPASEAALKNGTTVDWLTWNWSGGPNPIVGDVSFGWWMAAAIINPTNPDQVMYGTGATIWATDNINNVDNNQAPTWYVNAQGIEETANLGLISPTSGANLLSVFGDISGFRHTSLSTPQPMFEAPVFGSGSDIDWAGASPNVIVRVGTSNGATGTGCGMAAFSSDEGEGWDRLGNCITGANSSSWTGGNIAIDASGRHIVWTAPPPFASTISEGPYYSSDNGTTWNAPSGLNIQVAVTGDKVQAGVFYAVSGGVFYVSKDSGASYTALTNTGLPSGAATRPVASIINAGELWIPVNYNGIYHSTDFGTSFTKLPGTISPASFSVGKHAPGHPHKPALYVWGTVTSGGATGLYRSDDGGSTWDRINDDEHQYGGPSQIQGDSQVFGRCYMGMNGRGIVYADIDTTVSGGGVAAGTYGM